MATAFTPRPIGYVIRGKMASPARRGMTFGSARDEARVRLWPSAEQVAAEARLAAQKLAALRADRRGGHEVQPRLGIDVDGNEVIVPGDVGYSARPDDETVIAAARAMESERPLISYRMRDWFSWLKKHRATRGQIEKERSPSYRNWRLDALSRVGAIPGELARVLSEDHPRNVDKAMECFKALPWEQVEQLLTDVVRMHPSPTVRDEAQKAILAEDPFKVDIENLPEVRDDDPPTSVMEAAALMEGRWSIFLFKKLVAKVAWNEVDTVLRSTDYPYRQDLAYVLWNAGRGYVRVEVAEIAYAVLPPHALIWKSRMKKLASY